MRFATFLVGAFAIVVSAQSTTTETTGATSASLTPAQSSQAACLEACAAGDVDCQARCIAVPSPSGSQVNATTDCVADCDQGNGTAADNSAYGTCVQNCIDDNYFTSTGTPAESTAAGSGSSASTGSAASATGTSESGSTSKGSSESGTSTATSSSSSSTSSSSSADAVRVGITGASLFGLLAAFVAL